MLPNPDPLTSKALQFEIGAQGDRGPAAQVAVDKLVKPQKRGLFRVAAPVATGIAVRFEQLEVAALDEIPPAVQAFANTRRVHLRRLALFAPGDPVPRLMADEAVVRARGEWILKRVLLADRPSAAECRLTWKNGVAKLTFPKGATLGVKDLLAVRQ